MIVSGINLVMTVIGFVVSTMFIVFVCTRLICARIQLTTSRGSFSASARSDLSLLERGLGGLEPVVLATFPTRKFSHGYFPSGEDMLCTICLAEFQGKDTLRILPYCGHAFHILCIDVWLQQHSTCPVCRISLINLPEKKRILPPMFSPAVPFSCSSIYDGHEQLSRTLGNHMGESAESNSCTYTCVDTEVVEVPPFLRDGNHVQKGGRDFHHLSQNKLLESASNP